MRLAIGLVLLVLAVSLLTIMVVAYEWPPHGR